MALAPGTILHERYRIDRVIAQGGMGAVYMATDESLGVPVAVKENLISSDDSSRQFHREATILAGMRHPNLPRVTDHFIIPNQGQYLVMDFIEGQDLKQQITSLGRLNEEETALVGIAICDALAYLHGSQPPIVHRDIKPGNIKITPAGEVYLVDFGLAKVAAPGAQTTTGAQALTPGYAPPEQYGQGTTPLSDIYALGATLYAAITGNVPADGLERAMGTAILTPVRTLNPQVSPGMAAAIEKAMAIAPVNRFQSAAEFKAALQSANTAARQQSQKGTIRINTVQPPGGVAVTLPAFAGPEVLAPRLTPAAAKKRSLLLPLIIGGVALAGVAVVAVLFFSGALGIALANKATSTPPPVASSPTIPLAAQTQPADTPIPPQPTTPPDQPTPTVLAVTPTGGGTGEIAFASNRGGEMQIWLMNADGSNQHQLTGIAGGACQPDFSPDGMQLVFISPCSGPQVDYRGSALMIMNIDGSGLRPVIGPPGGDFEPAWSPDGTRIAFTSLREGIPHIFILNLGDGTATQISPPSANDHAAAWSPDGQWIAFQTTRLGVLQVWVMDPSGGNAREFAPLDRGRTFAPVFHPNGLSILYSVGSSPSWLASQQYTAGTGGEAVEMTGLRPALEPDYSPDGMWLTVDSDGDIYLMMANGAGVKRLTDDPAIDFGAVWR